MGILDQDIAQQPPAQIGPPPWMQQQLMPGEWDWLNNAQDANIQAAAQAAAGPPGPTKPILPAPPVPRAPARSVFAPNNPRTGWRGVVDRINDSGFVQGLERGLNSPLTRMGLAMMQQSSIPGQTFAGGLGQAGLQTLQNMRAQKDRELKRQLMQAQIYGAYAGAGGDPKTEFGKIARDLALNRITQEEADKLREKINVGNVQDQFKLEADLRKEYRSATGDIDEALLAISQSENLIYENNPVSVMAAFVSMIKSIDNSTVREGELRNFESVRGYMGKLDNLYQRNVGRGVFSEDTMIDIRNTIRALRENLEAAKGELSTSFRSTAEAYKLDPSRVVTGYIPSSPLGPRETPGVLPPGSDRTTTSPVVVTSGNGEGGNIKVELVQLSNGNWALREVPE